MPRLLKAARGFAAAEESWQGPGSIAAEIAAFMGLSGDPTALELSDLDASEDFFITESEDGNAVLNGPRGSRETIVPFSEETDSFEELADYSKAAFTELKALSGDPTALELSDLDASEDFFITASEDGNVVLNGPRGSRETILPFSEESDSFVELIEYSEAAIAELKSLSGNPTVLEASDLDASDSFFITESEGGNAVLNGPRGDRETRLEFSETTDSFVEIGETVRDTAREMIVETVVEFDGFDSLDFDSV